MPAEDLDIWSDIIETGERGLELGRVEDWNMDRDEEERKILNNQTI